MGFRMDEQGCLLKFIKESKEETDIIIPDGVTEIGDQAFSSFRHLKSVIIPEGVTKIGHVAFGNCESLQHIVLPSTLRTIDHGAFQNCYALEEITLPKDVEVIGNWAFYKCSALRSVSIPEGVEMLGDWAFYGCSALRSVSVPKTVHHIGPRAFEKTPWLEEYPSEWVTLHTILYRYKDKEAVCADIPDGITHICAEAFYECRKLAFISFPDSIQRIGSTALCHTRWYAAYEDDFVVVNGILHYYKGDSRSVTLPETVTRIDESSCFRISLKEVHFGEHVKSISKTAFPWEGFTIFFHINDTAVEIFLKRRKWQPLDYDNTLLAMTADAKAESEHFFSLIENSELKLPLAILLTIRHGSEQSIAYLRQYEKRAFKPLIAKNNISCMRALLRAGVMTSAHIDYFINYANAVDVLEIQTLLMHYKAEAIGYPENPFSL